MIIWEDEGWWEEDDLLFPCGVVIEGDGTRRVTAQPWVKEAAEWLDTASEEELYSEKGSDHLFSLCQSELQDKGFTPTLAKTVVYKLRGREEVKRDVILESSQPLMPDDTYENKTTLTPDPFGEGYLAFGTVRDGAILSMATENPHEAEATVIDIGVETAEGAEGLGYATSNVAALAYYLLDPGREVTYIAEEENQASHKVAEKVGFTAVSRELRLVAYREEPLELSI